MQATTRWISLTITALVWIHTANALPTLEELISGNEKLQLYINKSEVIALQSSAQKVSVVASEIADVQILDPKQILVTGKKVGETSIVLWMEDGSSKAFDVTVNWNVRQIKKILDTVMPDEAIEVMSLENGVALRGSVSRIDQAQQAMELTQTFVPKVINLLNVPGNQQVLLKVKVAEVARSFGDELGADFRYLGDSFNGGSLLGNVISGDVSSGGVNISEAVTMFFGFPNSNFDVFIKALREKGLLYVLAEPNLVARNGETASFLAGGEFPIPVVQSGINSSITIEYKEFGVRLNFTPNILSEKTIQMEIAPEVSDLDFSRGVSVGGYVLPVITTRRARTSVKMDDGQTFAIAGLINQSKQRFDKKVPYAGDIPIFGNLFRSKDMVETETELLIMVTPHLIAPLEAGEETMLPTDDVTEKSGWFLSREDKEKEQLNANRPVSYTQPIDQPVIISEELPAPQAVAVKPPVSENRMSHTKQTVSILEQKRRTDQSQNKPKTKTPAGIISTSQEYSQDYFPGSYEEK